MKELICTTCENNLRGAAVSAKNERGEFYIICPGCGQVYMVKHNEIGLTYLEKTKNDCSPTTIKQMHEAKRLFEEAGINIGAFKTGIHSEVKDSVHLELSEEEMEMIREKREELIAKGFTLPSLEQMAKDYVEYRKDPVAVMKRKIAEKLNSLFEDFIDDDEEECCEFCGCCDDECCCDRYEDIDDEYDEDEYEDEEENISYIAETILNGKHHTLKLTCKEELEELLSMAYRVSYLKVSNVYELKPVDIKKTSYQIV